MSTFVDMAVVGSIVTLLLVTLSLLMVPVPPRLVPVKVAARKRYRVR